MKDFVLVGAGGHAREIVDLVSDHNQNTPRRKRLRLRTVVAAGKLHESIARLDVEHFPSDEEFFDAYPSGSTYILALGLPQVRRSVAIRYRNHRPISVVHPSASVGSNTCLGVGTLVFAGACLTTDVQVGSQVHFNRAVQVGHDCRIGDYASLHPGAVLSGGVTVAETALVGAGALILENLKLGTKCRVGAGAVVTKNVDANTTVVGVPASPLHRG